MRAFERRGPPAIARRRQTRVSTRKNQISDGRSIIVRGGGESRSRLHCIRPRRFPTIRVLNAAADTRPNFGQDHVIPEVRRPPQSLGTGEEKRGP